MMAVHIVIGLMIGLIDLMAGLVSRLVIGMTGMRVARRAGTGRWHLHLHVTCMHVCVLDDIVGRAPGICGRMHRLSHIVA